MLERLTVASLGIIDDVVLELTPGFTVLTGETGAGKSLLVESLKLIAGSRAQSDLIREGADTLRVEAWFSSASALDEVLVELGIRKSETLIVRREVASSGRSRAWVNDVAVTASSLQRMAPYLMAIHGQHEQYGLADPRVQRNLVDEFAGHAELVHRVRTAFNTWKAAADACAGLEAARERRRDRLDTIAFQLAEIDDVAPQPGEDTELGERRHVMRHAVRIIELSQDVLTRLDEEERSVAGDVAKAVAAVEEMGEYGLAVGGMVESLNEARVHVEEVARELRAVTGEVSGDPVELDALEARLHRLDWLVSKYGSPLDEVLTHRERLIAERHQVESVEGSLESARAHAAQTLDMYDRSALALDRSRREAASEMAEQAARVLERLDMPGTRLDFRWVVQPQEASPLRRDGEAVSFDADGVLLCELHLAPNPGEEPKPMARIASGGELSRLHLALRTVLRGRLKGSGLSLLFDEVDSGLGGGTAAALAGLLHDLAGADQVLVVTHLPQVAARAAGHLRVEKLVVDGRAVTRVQPLSGEERVSEIARMLAGHEVGESARAHASSLLGGS